MTNSDSIKQDLHKQVATLSQTVLKQYAQEVDAQSRFPFEALDALKSQKLLSVGNDSALGGLGLDVMEQAQLCKLLAKGCASTAMILGMHYIKCNSLNRWGRDSEFFQAYLSRQQEQQRLIASMTSEEGIGGDLRQSQAAVHLNDSEFTIEKSSPCLSYVNEADDILLTCRASEQAPASDQRLLLLTDEQMQKSIKHEWDAMGMRGTCSHACVIQGQAQTEQILETPFATIANQGMIPDAHIIWASIWLGIAQDAFSKAKKVSRKQFLKDDSQLPGSARILNEMYNLLLALEGQITTLASAYVLAQKKDDLKFLRSSEFAISVNSLKMNASQHSKSVCLMALDVCGIAGYKNDDENSVAKHIRDVLSASVMVSNERLITVNAARLML